MSLVHTLISIYIWILIITAFLSWIPVRNSQGPLVAIKRILADITEPVLRPLRAIMPRINAGGVGIDLSVFVAVIILLIVNAAI